MAIRAKAYITIDIEMPEMRLKTIYKDGVKWLKIETDELELNEIVFYDEIAQSKIKDQTIKWVKENLILEETGTIKWDIKDTTILYTGDFHYDNTGGSLMLEVNLELVIRIEAVIEGADNE